MKIGIIYYSETKHTEQVCLGLKDALEIQGHDVTLEEVKVFDIKTDKRISFSPSINGYDLIVFGTPVQGFSLPIPMQYYLKSLTLPQKQKIEIIITQYFKIAWLGANHTIRQILDILRPAQPDLCNTAIVHWSSKRRTDQIVTAIKRLSEID